MAKVYRFKCYDVTSDDFGVWPKWGTLEAIDSLRKCAALVETQREVKDILLNDQGFLIGEPPPL